MAVTLGGQWVRFIIQFASITILARLLTPADFGRFAMIMAVVGVATILSDSGLSLAAVQSKTISQGQAANLFWINLAIGIGLAVAVYVLAAPIAEFYGDSSLKPYIELLSGVFVLTGIAVQLRAELTRKMRFGQLALVDIFSQGAALAVAVVMAASGHGLWALIFQQITIAAVTLIVLAVFFRRLPGWPSRGASITPLLKFGGNTMVAQTVNYASANVDSILLGRFHSAGELGMYDRAYQLFRMPMTQLAAPMTRVALPVLSRIVDDTDRYQRYVRTAQGSLAYALLGVFFFAAASADPLIGLLLGEGWDLAPLIFQILAVGGAFQAIAYVYYWIFLSTGRVNLHLRYSLLGRALMLLLIAVGAYFGPVQTAFATAVGFAVVWAIYTCLAIPKVGVPLEVVLKPLVRPIALYSGLFVVVWISYSSVAKGFTDILQLGVGVLVSCVYLVLAFCLSARVRRDFNDIRQMVSLGLNKRDRAGED